MKICFPIEKNDGMRSTVSGHFGSAPLLVVIDTANQQLVELGGAQGQPAGRARLSQLLNGQTDALIANSIGRGAYNKLKAAGVKVYRADGATITDNLLCLADQRLPELAAEQLCSQAQGAAQGHGKGHGKGKGHAHAHGHGAGAGCGCH